MKKKVLIIAREGNPYNVDELVKAHIKALQEVERVLKPGGEAYSNTSNNSYKL